MVIHTKKKMNIHKAEAVKDMKTKAVNLKVAGAASLGTVTNQVEGGKEVNEAATIMVAMD